ncbi:inner nuclear membrane protein Man1 [Oryzias melastigma]|uniref:inner nuclear membrane protein Man1 n=1 Tax=Oryzias melastigma TaxID=30732 RepID=UPI000CF82ED5|nr:inner nuclear membrane protein Man1 [Oryzias melastigma]
MASAQLTDEELFTQLKRLGFTPGPVTENTRPVYLKKLKKLREEQQQRGSRGVKSRASAAASTAVSIAAPRPSRHDVTQSSAIRKPGRKSSVLGFSSDESDAEIPLKRKGLTKHRRSPAYQQELTGPADKQNPAGTTQNSFSSPLDHSVHESSRHYDESGDEDEEEPENPRSVNGREVTGLNKTAGEYSDSDEEGALSPSEAQSRPEPRRSRMAAPLSPLDDRGSQVKGKNNAPSPLGSRKMVRGEDEEVNGEDTDPFAGSQRYPRKSIYVSLAEQRGAKAGKNHFDGEDGAARSNSATRFSVGLRPRFSGYSSPAQTHKGNHSNHSPPPNHAYSQTAPKKKLSVPEDELLLQFRREEPASSGSFSAHYLSMFLLTTACLFFLLLGLMYLRMRGSVEADGVIKRHPFGREFDESYSEEEKDLILTLLLSLHNHLAVVAGQHECGDLQHPNRSLSLNQSSTYLQAQNQEFESFTLVALEWIIKTDQDVGLRLLGEDPQVPVTDVSEISQLESTRPRMPLTCRLRRAFLTVGSKVLLVAAAAAAVWATVRYLKFRWRRQEEETRQMYDMVERIIDVLRTHGEACQENQDLLPYLPIPHVRDSLVLPQDRKKMKKVWGRAVCFLSANESRIRTETQRIGGADFLVWRWIQPSLSGDKANPMPSKVWQGQAFPLDRRNSPPNSLTPCLKIRNMFDPIMEVGENWDLAIHEAILEKCSDNDGIVHIAVDKNSREGCVYVKCLTAEHSGKAFKALHGSWFDGKLVTVKYLRLDRYHQRFPQAQACSTPLKASSLRLNSSVNSSVS